MTDQHGALQRPFAASDWPASEGPGPSGVPARSRTGDAGALSFESSTFLTGAAASEEEEAEEERVVRLAAESSGRHAETL